MAPITHAVHHHRNTTKTSHKAFKSKHASKSALKERNRGKVETGERGVRKTPHQQLMSKLDRKNQARQKQQLKHQEKASAVSIFNGQNGAPRQVAIVPLSDRVDIPAAIRSLNESVDVPENAYADGLSRIRIDRFKQNILYIPTSYDLMSALDVCRVADFVVLVLPTDVEVAEEGENLLRSIESQGISNVLVVAQGVDKLNPPKRRPQVISSLKSYINHFFPSIDKVLSLDSRQECSNVVRGLCTATPKGIRWRDDRSWMLIQDVKWPENNGDIVDNVTVTGVVRGKGLKADRIVHIPGWGDFQVDSITAAPLPTPKGKKEDVMNIDDSEGTQVLDQPTEDCDDMATVAPEEIEMEDDALSNPDAERRGVLLDDHHYFSEDESHIPSRPKRLPKGTSDYQAAWFLEDDSDSGSDMIDMEDEDVDMDVDETEGRPEDGVFPDHGDAMTEAGPSEYPQSEMFLDPSPEDEADQLEEYRASRRTEEKDDLEFPDEIELHPNVLARERLQKYRGLKSLKTSNWETSEDRPYEPEDWRRLLQFNDYKGLRNKLVREALVGGVTPGTRVNVHLKAVPSTLRNRPQPVALFSLLRHEHKHTVINMNITVNSSVEEPIKSKEEVIIQCGPRRLVVNPIFSGAGNTPNNVHKFDRFLHPGRSAIASFIGPVIWGAVPVLVFKNQIVKDPEVLDSAEDAPDSANTIKRLELIATGTVVASDHSRVVAKRAILTGHPFKIHKKVVTVRYMFFNAEDVHWFKALQLWTRRGRSGFVKESLGTHGYFKATFDAKINPQDSIGISLYKRVFPRLARAVEEVEASA
ncbi:putative pre-rRNA processing protein Tsr1 [Talaromyces proteolyticus]|uniref:Pre-rRNA processing protein Tsr1 n=1 Tax=Talaromyces proteolyticus TaxID=1131652 RepID=A0AAD4L6S8_9EURO|nr:putative pre-rRNA processing protein Tsr1 [Talaromyces proteolyticus]KAH8705635.1 putative pre-rRNA processing protein Tsr1 [Talaromyces proteolyticus]